MFAPENSSGMSGCTMTIKNDIFVRDRGLYRAFWCLQFLSMTNGDLPTAASSPIKMAGAIVLRISVNGKSWLFAVTADGCHGGPLTLVPRWPSTPPTVSKSLRRLGSSRARSMGAMGGSEQIVELQPEDPAPERVNRSS
jgi:hypothetical protein